MQSGGQCSSKWAHAGPVTSHMASIFPVSWRIDPAEPPRLWERRMSCRIQVVLYSWPWDRKIIWVGLTQSHEPFKSRVFLFSQKRSQRFEWSMRTINRVIAGLRVEKATRQRMRVASRIWERPLADSQRANRALLPVIARNGTLSTRMSLEVLGWPKSLFFSLRWL